MYVHVHLYVSDHDDTLFTAGLEEEEEWAGPGGGASHPIASQEWGEPLDTEWTTPTGGGGAGLEQAGLVDTFDGKVCVCVCVECHRKGHFKRSRVVQISAP